MTSLALLADHRLMASQEEPTEDPKYWISDALRLRIQEEIRSRGRVMSKLARLCHVSNGTIQQIENGSIKSTAILPTLSGYLGIDWVEYLVPDELQRRSLRALEKVRREAGDEVAAEFAVEVERLGKRIVAEARDEGRAVPQEVSPSPL